MWLSALHSHTGIRALGGRASLVPVDLVYLPVFFVAVRPHCCISLLAFGFTPTPTPTPTTTSDPSLPPPRPSTATTTSTHLQPSHPGCRRRPDGSHPLHHSPSSPARPQPVQTTMSTPMAPAHSTFVMPSGVLAMAASTSCLRECVVRQGQWKS